MDLSHKRGDTFQPQTFEILLNDSPLDLTGAEILCHLKKNATDSDPALEVQTSITDASAGIFELDEQIIDIVPRDYVFDVQITLASGRVLTPVSGTFTITPDVSR